VQRVSDRVVILERGRLIAQGRIEELLAGDSNLFYLTVRGDGSTVKNRLLSISWIKKIELETGVPDLTNNRTTKLQIHVSDAWAAETELLRLAMQDPETIVTHFERSTHNLEDIFVNLVSGGTKYE
jgi:ABC-2 type transport system ATP-binding protein